MDSPDTISGDRNRSLQRGIELLRVFRPGSDLYGNGELAERTGLSRATVSRLAQSTIEGAEPIGWPRWCSLSPTRCAPGHQF